MASRERLNDLILEELAQAVNREVGVENALITIAYVDCSSDLSQAKVGFSILPDNLAGTALRRLNSATNQIVAILKKRLKLRKIPHLIWEFDSTEKEANRLEQIITEVLEEDVK